MTPHLERDARRRRNGDADDTMRELGLGPAQAPTPSRHADPWILAGILAAGIAFTITALGAWKLAELIIRGL